MLFCLHIIYLGMLLVEGGDLFSSNYRVPKRTRDPRRYVRAVRFFYRDRCSHQLLQCQFGAVLTQVNSTGSCCNPSDDCLGGFLVGCVDGVQVCV